MGARGTPVRVPVDPTTFHREVDATAHALKPRTRVVLINTPNNPTGWNYPAATRERLADALRRHGGSRDRAVYLLLMHTYSKSSLAPEQRLGYLALPPSMPGREQFRQIAVVAALATGNALPDAVMQYALADIEHIARPTSTDSSVGEIRCCEAGGKRATSAHPGGDVLPLPRRARPDDWAFARAGRDKLLVLPGQVVEMPRYLRVSLIGTDDTVERSLPIFERAIQG